MLFSKINYKSIIIILILLFINTDVIGSSQFYFGNNHIKLDPKCRNIRNLRNFILDLNETRITEINSYIKIEDCIIVNECNKLSCSINTNGSDSLTIASLNLNHLCDDQDGPQIEFNLESIFVRDDTWVQIVSPIDHSFEQKFQVPLNQNGEKTYFLVVNFLQQNRKNPGMKPTLNLSVEIESCSTKSCYEVSILRNVLFPLQILCDIPKISNSNLLLEPKGQVQVPTPITSQIGMSCKLDEPYLCGANTICRRDDSKKDNNKGICYCCSSCELLTNGTCIRTHPSTQPSSQDEPNAGNGGNGFASIAFITIVTLLLILFVFAGIYYGRKHNVFLRVQRRIRLYYTNWCSRRIVRVNSSPSHNNFNSFDNEGDQLYL